LNPSSRFAAQGLGAHTPQPKALTFAASSASPEVTAQDPYSEQTSPNGHVLEAAKWGFALGFVAGLGVALVVFVGSILVTAHV
jgi:hypothetical protein